ncbi:MAG: hypothetical protein HY870_11955 [Chloroflexi bacterium]|nr:hypothetical protein [Chloroflexota bacterium]
MKVAVISGAYPRREVVVRGVSHKLGGDPVQSFSCIEDVLISSMGYDAFVVYNNFDKKMNGIDGTREIRRAAPDAYIIGVSAIPYMERQFLPAGADRFLLLAGNEIAELGDLLLKVAGREAKPNQSAESTVSTVPVAASAPKSSAAEDPVLSEQLVHTLERARLLLDYAANAPDPVDLQRYIRVMGVEIERVITRYYQSKATGNGQRSK